MTETTAVWPYRTIRDAESEHYRIPLIDEIHPRNQFEVCVVVGDTFYGGQKPSTPDYEVLSRYLAYRMIYYNASWTARMRKRPFDTDDTTNTLILLKLSDRDWSFARASWRGNSDVLVPAPFFDPERPQWSLAKCLNQSTYNSTLWNEWKRAHPLPMPTPKTEDAS